MLQFWRKDKQKSPHSSPQKIYNGTVLTSFENELGATIGPLSHFVPGNIQNHPCEPKSRLSLNLEDVFNNKTALFYFTHFMDSHGYGNIFSLLSEIENISIKYCSTASKPLATPGSSPKRSTSLRGSDSSLVSSVKECTNPKRIFSQYLCDDAPCRVRLPEDLKIEVILVCNNENIDYSFDNLKEYLYQHIRKEYWVDFLNSDSFCKYQIEIMTSGKMSLSDVLYNNACLTGFIEYLEQEGCGNIIEFWLAATSFEKHNSLRKESVDSTQIQNDAIIIYDQYLSLQATSPLGVNDKVRFAVEEGICGETETAPDCLAPAVCLVEAFLRTTYLRLFFSSNQYLSILSDVMTSSQPRSSSSPSSSVTDGIVENCLPCEQDHLWRRRRQNSGLSFGRIDQLGRYETDIEPEPDKKSESRISRVVKLIMNKDERKSQEEMAWRVAEMIVKDITSITMGTSQFDEDF